MALRRRFLGEIASLGLPGGDSSQSVVQPEDLAPLPDVAQRYLRYMGVVGRPRDTSFRLSFVGRFKVHARAPWRRCETWQYNSGPDITRTFFMRMLFGGIPIIGRDTYRDGHGRMVGKLLDLVTVIDGRGAEFDVGELVTYLNDLVLIAPSMLLASAVTWTAVDEHAFDLALTDHGHTVKARVFVDADGAPVDFETDDRFVEDPHDRKRLMRARWRTPIEGLQLIDGRRVLRRGQAVWSLPQGDFPYADFELVPASLAFNVAPGQ